MRAVHPGRILKRELKARELSANALALALRTPSGRITDILNEKRAVTTETAMRLGRYFGQSPRFWINLQSNYDLALAEAEIGKRLDVEVARAG
jgi:addiction module HigA family antidote